VRINAYQWLRPKGSLGVDVLDLFSNVVGANLGKRASKRRVFANEVAIQAEYVHESSCPNWSISCLVTIARSEFSLAARLAIFPQETVGVLFSGRAFPS
jgi:hypothetical protein